MSLTLARWQGQVDRTLQDHDDAIDDLQQRLGTVEKFMWKTVGAALIGSILGGGVVTVVAYLVVGAVQHHP